MAELEINLERLKEEDAKGYKESDLIAVKPIIPFLRSSVTPWLVERINVITQHPKDVREELAKRRTNSEQLSRPVVCADYIRDMGRLYLQAQNYLDQGLRGQFVVWYLLANGVRNNALCIERAEGVLRRGVSGEIVYAFKGEIPNDVEEVAQRFQQYNQRLITDPTGISLMEYQVWITSRNLFDFPDPRNETFSDIYHPTMLLAAMHAAEVYRKIYPLSA